MTVEKPVEGDLPGSRAYLNPRVLDQLRSAPHGRWDTTKLIAHAEEFDACVRSGHVYASHAVLQRTDRDEEVEGLRHALEAGHAKALSNLLEVLARVGRSAEAEELQRLGIEPGGGRPTVVGRAGPEPDRKS